MTKVLAFGALCALVSIGACAREETAAPAAPTTDATAPAKAEPAQPASRTVKLKVDGMM